MYCNKFWPIYRNHFQRKIKYNMLNTFLLRFSKRRPSRPRPCAIPRGPGPGAGPEQYSPHEYSPHENGCDSSPTATQAPTNGVNGSSRSSPLYNSPGKNNYYCQYSQTSTNNHLNRMATSLQWPGFSVSTTATCLHRPVNSVPEWPL